MLLNRRKPIISHHQLVWLSVSTKVQCLILFWCNKLMMCCLCLFYIIEIIFCSNRLTTEGNLAANIAYVAKWTDEQRQTEDGLNTKIQDQAKTM